MDMMSSQTWIWCASMVVVMTVTQTACIAGPQTPSPAKQTDSQVEMTPSPVIHADCMAEWLHLAGASPEQIANLLSSGSLVLAKLDERFVNDSSSLLLTFALGFNTKLAGQLKVCISGSKPCPAGSDATDRPCTQSGECVFSEVSRDTQCNCTYGLLGKRCRQDLDECSRSDLNDCDVTNGYCINTHGSYGCECNSGFYEKRRLHASEDRQCKDIDECTDGTHVCHSNATCTNTAGSYDCQCKQGFQGDGFDCSYDMCESSPNSGMCRKVSSLEEMLYQKDAQVQRLSKDVTLILTLLSNYDRRFKIQEKDLRLQLNVLNESLSEEISRVEDKCTGILHWKSFTRTSRNSRLMPAWNVQFEKRRSDTTLRVLYTTSMGVQTSSSAWECFTVSFLFNGSECSDPAPIRGGFSGYQEGSSYYEDHKSVPAAISGVCNINKKGLLTITSRLQSECHASFYDYHGYYHGTSSITSSLHIDEMCP